VESLYARGWTTVTTVGYGGRLVQMEQNAASFISSFNADRVAKLWKDAFPPPSVPHPLPRRAAPPASSATRAKLKKTPPVAHSESLDGTSVAVPAPALPTAEVIEPSEPISSPLPIVQNEDLQPHEANSDLQRFRSILPGTWRGTYICAQGESAAELEISDANDLGELRGTFRFFNLPNHHNVSPGEYTVSATYYASGNSFSFRPVKWVLAPPGYSMVGFNLSLESDNKLIGRVNSPGCQGISLQK